MLFKYFERSYVARQPEQENIKIISFWILIFTIRFHNKLEKSIYWILSHFIGMKLIKIWHFQFGDFEIEKPETCQIVTKVYSIGQSRIKSGHCCLCSAHGSWLTALDASDRWFLLLALAVSCEGPRRLSCYYSTRGLPRHCPVTVTMVSTRGWHLVILSQDVCLAPGGRLLSLSH